MSIPEERPETAAEASAPAAKPPGPAAPAPRQQPKQEALAGTPAEPPQIPTGFPEPVTPDEPRELAADGKVRLAPAGFGSLTVPPLEPGGETVVIGPEGTDVDEETAERAYEAARLAGFTLREL